MKKRNKIIIIICASVILVALFAIAISRWIDAYEDKHELDDLKENNLLSLSLESNNSDNHDERIEIEVDFEKRTIIILGTRKEFSTDEQKEVELTEEQCQRLKEYVVEYTYKVKAKEKEYWPQTDEYPAMYGLFSYEIKFGEDEEYSQTGALCYPDGWEEFLDMLIEH